MSTFAPARSFERCMILVGAAATHERKARHARWAARRLLRAARTGSRRRLVPRFTAAAQEASMKAYKTEFLELALELGVLQFGEFKLKSGRVSPYFFNAGLFNSGYAAAKIGRCYASAITSLDLEFDMLFGAAYKAIPLV